MEVEEDNTLHICQYCGAETNQSDDECYANPNESEVA